MFKVTCVFFMLIVLAGGFARAETLQAQGSDSTMVLFKALAQGFEKESGHVFQVTGGGSTAGAKACLSGDKPVAFLSRALKDSEVAQGLVGVPYAIDGVAVIVNGNNDIQNVSLSELKDILSGERTAWENGQPIVVLTRNQNSGTREVLKDRVLGKDADFVASALIKHNGIMDSTVQKIPNAIGYTSFGDLKEEGVKVLSVEGVALSREILLAGVYPLSRTLSIATKGAAEGAVRDFLDFVRSEKGKAIVLENGYVPLETLAGPEEMEGEQERD